MQNYTNEGDMHFGNGADMEYGDEIDMYIGSENNKDFNLKKNYEAWILLSEVIKREILENEEFQKVVLSFITHPVSQELTIDFITQVSNNFPRLKKLLDRYNQQLSHLIDTPIIPESLIEPDLANAHSQPQGKGLTIKEYELVGLRYRIARDIKLLALCAELINSEVTIDHNKASAETSNHVRIIGEGDEKTLNDLLQPENWIKRKQLKDRVYLVEVKNHKYILKERKTDRHTNTTEGGHIPGLTSQREYETAQELSQMANLSTPEIKLTWENPVGYVVFPDGFQFVLFKYEEGSVGGYEILDELEEFILKNHEQFKSEYLDCLSRATKFLKDRRMRTRPRNHQGGPIKNLIWQFSPRIEDYTFEQFARVKAYYLRGKASRLLDQGRMMQNYVNSDSDDCLFRINDQGPYLEIIGIDLEYFSKVTNPEYMENEKKALEAWHKKMSEAQIIRIPSWRDDTLVLKEDEAMYLALKEKDDLSKDVLMD